jgi:transcription elongation GreA/GreB family factor/very-short-patch-repair endonuclease
MISLRLDSSALTSALEQLRLRLLDLTGRNRLINFKHAAGKSLQFVEGHPAAIYHKLVEANSKASISILGLPEPTRRDWVDRNGRLERPEPRDWAKSMRIPVGYDIPGLGQDSDKSNVRTLMYPDDLAKHCRKIEREAILAIEETGANMLFLVLGFLEFPDQRDSDKAFTAPLISVPVSFQKKEVAGIQQFSLHYTGDDISENLSLREKLRNDFGLILPELAEEMIDVNGYFAEIQAIIKKQPGFALKHRVSLCLLSFSNMLLVRDLDPTKWPSEGDKNSLIDHPIIRELFEGRADDGGTGFSPAEEHQVEEVPGVSIPLVYDADSSQHSALIDVLSLKKNLVIEGPPGTGKSQTITNLIAACLAEGKKVMFVAEKLAALEVVKNRLSLAGLDPYVLELHSNKTNKKRVLEEIAKRTTFRPNHPTDLPRLHKRLEAHRKDLKAYTDLINSVAYNAFGLTLHQIMWRAEKHRQGLSNGESMLSQINIGDATQISEFEFGRRMDCLGYLGSQYKLVGGFDASCTFWGFYPKRLIPGDEVKLAQLFESADSWGQLLVEASKHLFQALGGNVDNLSLASSGEQLAVLKRLVETSNLQLPLHLIPGFFKDDATGASAAKTIESFTKQIEQFHNAEAAVKAALKLESSVTKSGADDLKSLKRLADGVGAELGMLNELRSLHQQLVEKSQKLSAANAAIIDFFRGRNILYDGSKQKLEQLLRVTELVLDAPEAHLHLQTPGLTCDEAARAIEQLLTLQAEWTSLEKELSDSLYVDILPQEGAIKQAILTLREGAAWYRIFQGRWRKAVSLHKVLQRTKQKMSSHMRLEQLEQIIKMLRLKEQWKSSPTWAQFVGIPAPGAPTTLDGYLVLARWNQEIKLASEDLQAVLLNPINFTADQARALRRKFSTVKLEIATAIAAFDGINGKLKRLSEFSGGHLIEKVVERTQEFAKALENRFEWLELGARTEATFNQVVTGCDAALERSALKSLIKTNSRAMVLLGDLYMGVDTDCSTAVEALSFGQRIDGLNLWPQIKYKLRTEHPIETAHTLVAALGNVHVGLQHVEDLSSTLSQFGKFEIDTWVGAPADGDLGLFASALHEAVQKAAQNQHLLIPWSLYLTRREEASEQTLTEFVDLLENKRIKPDELTDVFAYCTYSTITREAFRNIPELGRFTGLKHNQIRDEFKRLDREIISLRGKAIAYECSRKATPPPGRNGVRVDDRTEMVLLNYLMPQQRPRMPVRKILTRAGGSIQALKPCFMMGPQAVAQYLAPGVIKFDLVIMDEASQLKPEEAIGSVARGGQLVVVGDPKQLPPTSFFSRMTQDVDGGDDHFTTTDAESILDVCSSHFRPTRSLRWHYRSQHHSLIAFSNHWFYGGNLIIFPSPFGQGGKLGVRAVYLVDAIYENQTNLREAKRVVEAVVEHIASCPNESLGIVTLNIKQRDLIAELLEERLKSVSGADSYREHWAVEGQPLFIKNLENVQGDERDTIMISTTFGKPAGSSAVRQNFGPISRQGGWRRLNVLFTRAKKSVAIYTSLRPEDIVMDGTTPDGTKALRNYLEYARSGSLTTYEETAREPDSDFEISVIDMLKLRGYEITPQLGVAGYRIDIAVKHPDAPGSYLAAIECDGASYHSALSVRDRDRIRQEILESLGWRGRIWRIWSTDWFRTPRQEADKLISFLENQRASWKPEYLTGEAWIEERQGAGQLTTRAIQEFEQIENTAQAEIDRDAVNSVLIDTEDDLEIEVGDVVRYADLTKPSDVLTVQITSGKDDFFNGIVNASRPLAQVLLGAVVGDEVSLHLAGNQSKTFQVVEIIKIETPKPSSAVSVRLTS